MSRRGGGRGSESRRDQPSPAASRGGGAGRGAGRGRGRGGPVPSPVPSPSTRTGPPPSQAVAPPQPARTGPASAPSAPASLASSSSSAPPKEETVAGEMVKLTGQDTPPAPPSSTKNVNLPLRPSYGKIGKKCLVRANHFLVKIADIELCQYDVSINPEVASKKVNRIIISHLVKSFSASHLGGNNVAYDGVKNIYTAGELPFKSKEFVIKLPDNDEQRGSSSSSASKSKKRDRDFKVIIKLAAKSDIHQLMEFIRGRSLDDPKEVIQALDIVLRHKPSEKYTVVGQKLFDHSLGDHGELGNGVEYWKGFYQSLRPTQMGLSLNVDVAAMGFYEPIRLIDFVGKYLNLRGEARPWTDQDRIRVRKALKGIKVESNHLAHKKTYKVTGISAEPINRLMFTLDNSGKQISVAQYFQGKYKIPIKYGLWPAIQAGSTAKPVSLPLEICSIVKGQRYTKKLNENQVRNILRATCKRPNERERSIKTLVDRNEYNKGEVVNQFGMNISAELTTVEARILPPPLILYHGTGRSATENPKMGAWNMIDKKMINPGRVDFWGCVNFSSWRGDSPYMFCDDFIEMCISRGMIFQRDPIVPIYSEHPMNIQDVLKRVHEESLQKIAKKTGIKDKSIPLQLLIVILPEPSGSFYGKIKRICETELGIVTQCCQPKKAEKGGKQYLENLSLKVNVKVGGRNSVLNEAVNRTLPIIGERPTIVFGADVTHPPKGEDSIPSIAAVVASMDWPEVTKYRGLVSAQGRGLEMIQDLYKKTSDAGRGVVHGGMIRDHLLAFYQKTRQKPDRILFYRDGVGEGQFAEVVLEEVDAIRKGCASLQKDYMPRVTFVVLQKRHHTRLFPVDNRTADRSGNVAPGTVVDTMICHPSQFDFFLNSHAGIQGTSRPAHYHVLFDENNFSADQLQMLTNSLCYTYARCTRSVSIVPPAYYAHLAAFRARYYLEDFADLESTSGGTTTAAGGSQPFHPLPVIKDNIKEVMFYC